jgi:DNA-binding MarR family transcriptional regulator
MSNRTCTSSPPPVLPADRDACLCALLRTIARRTSAVYEAHLAGSGLTQPQYTALARLDRLGTASLSALAAELELDITSASRNVKLLVAEGLIDVAAGPDARTKSYRLSRYGRRRLKAAYPAWQAAQTTLTALLGAKQRSGLITVASTLATHANAP